MRDPSAMEAPRGARPREATARDRAVGVACAVLSVLLFSSFTLASRLGLSSSLRLPDLAALRFGIGGTLLLPLLLRGGRRATWRDAGALAFLGGLGFALLAYAGFSLAPAAHGAVLLHGTLPLFTSALVRATAERRRAGPRAAGLVLIGLGIALMAYDSLAVASAGQLAGDGLLLLASLSWSAYGVMARRVDLPPATAAATVAVLSSVAFLPPYAAWPGKALLVVGPRELLLQAVVQGALVGAASIFVYTRAVAALGPATTALFAPAVPCITTLAAIPLLSEHPSGAALAGVAVVTVGMVAAARPSSGGRARAEA
ncbi:EamA family transporter [Anaeromyxobacter sp. Red801]|uniref:EamA family transporter n=1 Tax=Anaeromyxobacter sp. Red801 TaxID=3411632 RepID=UPI003BA1624A